VAAIQGHIATIPLRLLAMASTALLLLLSASAYGVQDTDEWCVYEDTGCNPGQNFAWGYNGPWTPENCMNACKHKSGCTGFVWAVNDYTKSMQCWFRSCSAHCGSLQYGWEGATNDCSRTKTNAAVYWLRRTLYARRVGTHFCRGWNGKWNATAAVSVDASVPFGGVVQVGAPTFLGILTVVIGVALITRRARRQQIQMPLAMPVDVEE
jgi:hypothetical protein